MNYQDKMLLPAGITEILPPEAAQLEQQRRIILDYFASCGYELVITPMIEYVESLLLDNLGDSLDLQTFKLIDQLNGRMLGVRADMTAQVARIEALHLKRDYPSRLCYLGVVLHTRPNSFAGSRAPIQLGAELYGSESIAADAEILALMIETLRLVGINEFHIDVGHAKIYPALCAAAGLNSHQLQQLNPAIKRKDQATVTKLVSNWQLDNNIQHMLINLVELHGDYTVLDEAQKLFALAPQAVKQALTELEQLCSHRECVAASAGANTGDILHFDLAEARGYAYHSGIIFAAYVQKHGEAIAKGGRYDHLMSKAFGKQRAATGFSTNLTTLVNLANPNTCQPKYKYLAPLNPDYNLKQQIHKLRAAGHIVITALPDQIVTAKAMGCTHELCLINGQWQAQAVENN